MNEFEIIGNRIWNVRRNAVWRKIVYRENKAFNAFTVKNKLTLPMDMDDLILYPIVDTITKLRND